jgi:hypothetical protein
MAVWSDADDGRLINMRLNGEEWDAIKAALHRPLEECRARLRELSRFAEQALAMEGRTIVVRTAPPSEGEGRDDRDGLLWLERHRRLTSRQLTEGTFYRLDFKAAEAAGATLRSGLDFGVRVKRSSAPTGHATHVVSAVDAQRRLYFKRFVVLRGQADMLDVLDGVCGRGRTLRDLAGGNGHEAKALEKLLRAALDLLASAREDAALHSVHESAHP